jgi:hypothetical protein
MRRSSPNPIVIFAWFVGVVAILFTMTIAEWEDFPSHKGMAALALAVLAYITITNYLRGAFSWHFSRAIQVYLFSAIAMIFYLFNHRMISVLVLAIVDGACVLIAIYLRIAFPPRKLAAEHTEVHPGWISFFW